MVAEDPAGLSSTAVGPEEAAPGDLGGAFGSYCEEEDSGGFDRLVAALPSSLLGGVSPISALLVDFGATGISLCEALPGEIADVLGLLVSAAGRACGALWGGVVVACCGALS